MNHLKLALHLRGISNPTTLVQSAIQRGAIKVAPAMDVDALYANKRRESARRSMAKWRAGR